MCKATSHVISKIYSAEHFFKIRIVDNLTPFRSFKIIEKLFRKEFHIGIFGQRFINSPRRHFQLRQPQTQNRDCVDYLVVLLRLRWLSANTRKECVIASSPALIFHIDFDWCN